ncbi:hypothetical protein GCM10011371_27300 [Novosphingobium marinum]|uniref:J domain-containing protein n=1 Tax=Novosphingobium marinum TaxID=1514948 RepID=A0A7Z0BSZ3_9SPHN|nr:molecular chaperone DnaJ [Novosphingobium marinum]NYH94654.1 hypothetical protein [Novosphingobium marinum]GGC38441.1 hypothetical protein GCM10011371_27300 [Novosphingobium marinum]
MKVLWIIVLAIVAWRLVAGRWPWQPKAMTVRSRSRDEARALLGLGKGAGKSEIVEAHRRRVAAVHPDRGGSNEAVHEANAARDLLLSDIPDHREEHERA